MSYNTGSQRRRSTKTGPGISLFPFLAVLICTMGALVPLLLAVSRTARQQAETAAVAKAAELAQKQQSELKTQQEDVHWRIEQLKKSRQQTEKQLADSRLELGHLEDHSRRLRQDVERYKKALAELEQLEASGSQQKSQATAELEQLRSQIATAERQVVEERKTASTKNRPYAVVPYEGPNQTRRRPIYLECRADAVILQPEGIRFSPNDLEGPLGPGNPLASALRAAREYMLAQREIDPKIGEPYPLLLVRPDGIVAYYVARQAMKSWGDDFGYELIGDDWKLAYQTPDAQLATSVEQAVMIARREQAMLIAAAPREYGRRSGSSGASGGSSGGGYGGSGGSGGGTGMPGGGNGMPGSGGGGMPGAGGNGLAGGGDGLAGTGNGGGYAPAGAAGLVAQNRGGTSGGSGDGSGPYASTGGNDGPYLTGNGGSSYGNSGSGNGLASGNSQGGNGNAAGNGGYAGSSGNNTGTAGSGYGTGNASGNNNGAAAGNGGYASGGSAPTASGSGSGGGYVANGGGSFASGNGTAGGNAGSCPAQRFGGSGTSGGPADAASAERPDGYVAGQPPRERDTRQVADASASQGGRAARPGEWEPTPDYRPEKPPEKEEQANKGQDRHRKPPIDRNDDGWASRTAGRGSVGVSRVVHVQCFADRLVVVSDHGPAHNTVIPFGSRTSTAVDPLVRAVWEQIEGWGIAGRGMYWRPILTFTVAADAGYRYDDIARLLDGSGMLVERK